MLKNEDTQISDEEKLNYEQNISDVMTIFPKLQTGIDVNIQFKDVNSFECTSELTVFDAFGVGLFHGWLPDPQDEPIFKIISGESYNQVVDRIITSKESEEVDITEEGLLLENFLDTYASQLTYHGLVNIFQSMSDHQLAVLFRNNHFSTLYKHKDELFTLVTDRGYLNKSNIVWETLSGVLGDTHFTDSNFITSPNEPDASDLSAINDCQQENAIQQPSQASEQLDRELAIQLDRTLNHRPHENRQQRTRESGGRRPQQPPPTTRQSPPVEHNTERRNSSRCIIT